MVFQIQTKLIAKSQWSQTSFGLFAVIAKKKSIWVFDPIDLLSMFCRYNANRNFLDLRGRGCQGFFGIYLYLYPFYKTLEKSCIA